MEAAGSAMRSLEKMTARQVNAEPTQQAYEPGLQRLQGS